MFGFVQNWFKPGCNPIGVDFGSDSLRLAQVEYVDNDFRLVAAASADVPTHVRHDPSARLNFFAQTTRDLLQHGDFRGRRAVLSLPASSMFIQHLRMAKMDDEDLKKALPWEARGKLPIDPSHALLRHLVAGEVYQEQEPKNEVILMAASRETVKHLLATAAKARLEVIGMNVEPKALIDCFSHVYRRKTDAEITNCFVDIGSTASRAVIARGTQILFARVIPLGGDHFNRAVATALKIGLDDAKVMRIKLCHLQPSAGAPGPLAEQQPADQEVENSFALLGAGLEASRKAQAGGTALVEAPVAVQEDEPDLRPGDMTREIQLVEQACREPLQKLVEELDFCRRYHESAFPNLPVQRLIFVGGEAHQRALCQSVAQKLMLAAQVGDPLVRMGRTSDIGIESGIDRRVPQPAWAVALGLSIGPAQNAPVEAK